MTAADRAEALHQEALGLGDGGETDAALARYLAALELDESRSSTHYNVGLIYKYRREWAQSLRYNRRSVELEPGSEGAQWNLAIAATALRDWRTARSVWHALGLPIAPGEAPIAEDFGTTPVRLNADGEGEVVWARRIDPVRARILSIPFPASGFRHGDVVLHDGAPVGYRLRDGTEYPVFNVLELFEASAYGTYEAMLRVGKPEDLAELEALCEALQIECEDWTSNVRVLCRQCSEGRPHEQHDHDRADEWQDRRAVGLAATDETSVRAVLDRWRKTGRAVERLALALAPERRH